MKRLFITSITLGLWALPAAARPPALEKDQLISRFEKYAEESRLAWGTPGMAVVLIADGKVLWSQGFGVKDAGGRDPVDVNTIFQIGSASKSFTSSLVALQVDRGQLKWADKVIDYDPDFRMFDPWVTREFTVEDTMSQRSGQPSYATDVLAFLGASRPEIRRALREVRPVSSFRSRFAYVNNLWLVSAQVVESVTGKTWEQSVASDIFQPLAMAQTNTGFEALWKSSNHITPHQGRKGSIQPLRDDWPFKDWVYTYGPAGGINSNVMDMARYVQMQLGVTPLIKAENLAVMHSPHVLVGGAQNDKPKGIFDLGLASYCLGWIRHELHPSTLIWHNGGTSGCKTVVGFCPDAGMGIVVLSNLGNTELPEALMFRYYDLYFGRPDYDYSSAFLQGRPAAPPAPAAPPNPRPPAALSEYAGQYRHPVYGLATVSLVGGGLEIAFGKTMRLKLKHWDGDSFAYTDPTESSDALEYASFSADPGGKFSLLRLTICDDVLRGRFVRQ
ncbi:MAG: serine hydrolase [Candidatus Eremiobacteraeota bacterium]|nr:serine hydrolase [Candidatus Eremiobacteraeota bacterium]MCW5866984.1 serine hydrolase [Candidatus Eremiobacteraeota bacterium]